MTSDLWHTLTDRLDLRAAAANDLGELYALHADPRVWEHLPSGVHTSQEQTASDLAEFQADWDRDGLGYWTVRRRDDARFVGIGGVRLRPSGVWNLYYRIAPEHHGHGYATEIAEAALKAAAAVRGDVPVIALLLEHNTPSRRVAERSGLRRVWRGPDADLPDSIRLLYADRKLDEALLDRLRS